MEALAFTLVFLATGSLPWVGVASKDWREKNARILELKESVSLEELGDLPQALALFFATVRQLGFQARPDYASYLRWFAEAREDLAESEGRPCGGPRCARGPRPVLGRGGRLAPGREPP